MKKYKSYSTYKPSGVEWLGEIPLHWEVIRLKHICWRAANYGANESSESYLEEGVRFLRTTDIDDFGNLSSEGAVFLEHSKVADYKLDDGDILISRSGTIGRSFLYSKDKHGECAFAGYLVRFSLKEKYLPKFIFYFTKSRAFLDYIGISIIQSTIGNVNGQKYANMSLSIPRFKEQEDIVSFLDRETTRIDTLITKKCELINLLEKKRATIINDAVTKGLNHQVAMKDSGLPWVGKIPEHWEVKRLKFISPEQTVGVVIQPSSYVEEDGEIPFILGSDISEGQINIENARRISEKSNRKLSKSMLRTDDLVCVRVGEPGITAVVPPELDGINCASIMIIRRSNKFNSHWLCYGMNSISGRANIAIFAYGAAQKQYNISHAINFQYPVPPTLEEQECIAKFIAHKISPINQANQKIIEQIKELKKYRQALITAAVTGKIDVREEVERGAA
ncbi:restriction endonuclease subunit S [Microcoleus sp.]|uniref:restriction endonuclease subunit S n=1 Tax=Microcoleus sp. TaxID=44472 RepID=UPI0035936831